MALTVTVQRGYTAQPGLRMTVDDLNQGFLPVVQVEGLVGSSDLQDGAVQFSHLSATFLSDAPTISTVAQDDRLLLGVTAGPYPRAITVANFLSGFWSSPALYGAFDSWSNDRMLYQTDAGELRAIAPSGLFNSQYTLAPVASALSTYEGDKLGVGGPSGATTMTAANLAKALIAQAPPFEGSEVVSLDDLVLLVDVSSGKTRKTTVGQFKSAVAGEFTSADLALPTVNGVPAEAPHGLAATPRFVAAFLRYVGATPEAGYENGDVCPIANVWYDWDGETETPGFMVWANSTKVALHAVDDATSASRFQINAKAGNEAHQAITFANWRVFLYAKL